MIMSTNAIDWQCQKIALLLIVYACVMYVRTGIRMSVSLCMQHKNLCYAEVKKKWALSFFDFLETFMLFSVSIYAVHIYTVHVFHVYELHYKS